MTITSMISALLLTCVVFSQAHAAQDKPTEQGTLNLTGVHDFDFLIGEWRVHSRKLKERLVGNQDWEEFEGTIHSMKTLNGLRSQWHHDA